MYEMKASVHLPFYWHETNSTEKIRIGTNRSQYVIRVVNEYLAEWKMDRLDLFTPIPQKP
jgi:hypothetical protein